MKVANKSDQYFVKYSRKGSAPLQSEYEGLCALRDKGHLVVPEQIKLETIGSFTILSMQWADSVSPKSRHWDELGSQLATLHQSKGAYFGWDSNNFIGALDQTNNPCKEWSTFFAEQRVLPLLKQAVDRQLLPKTSISTTEMALKRVEHFFWNTDPTLIHGDLWSGNVMFNAKGALFIDPAVYYGHPLMDLAMTKLFGGFDTHFYRQYLEKSGIPNDWELGVPLANLYPLLVHILLFGASYSAQFERSLRIYA